MAHDIDSDFSAFGNPLIESQLITVGISLWDDLVFDEGHCLGSKFWILSQRSDAKLDDVIEEIINRHFPYHPILGVHAANSTRS